MADLLDKPSLTADQVDSDSRFYVVVDPSGSPSDNGIPLNELTEFIFEKSLVDEEVVGGSTYQLVLTDRGKKKRFTSSSAVTVTVPANATVAFPVGTEIQLFQAGAGDVTISPASGVTINSLNGNLTISGQYGSATLQKRATDEWDLIGALK